MKHVVIAVVAALCGCAAHPENIQAMHVDETPYLSFTCEQLHQELFALTVHLEAQLSCKAGPEITMPSAFSW